MIDNQQQIDSLNNEIQVLQKRLESKSKAFSILINELDALKYERNQFKSLADSLQEKCVQLKKQATTKKNEPLSTRYSSQTLYEHPNDTDSVSLKDEESTIHLLKTALKTVQDEKEVLQAKVDELTHELDDVKGDLSIFRQKRNRTWNEEHHESQTDLLERLEQANERVVHLENDIKSLVCQKDELEIERDSFKDKSTKLNKMLTKSENSFIDIELVLSENRYLKEKLNEVTREKDLAMSNALKYKELLQTHQSERLQSSSGGSVLTYKQVRSLINQSYMLPNTPENENDLRAIAEALFENLKDKNVTIVHQRKINKILASRVAELEKRLVQCKLSEQTSSLIDLLGRTPSPDANTSQFVNNTDNSQQLSSNQIFSFPSSKSQTVKHPVTSTKTRNHSEGADLDMDDPLQSPQLASPLAYLKDRDLIPSSTSDFDFHHSNTDDTDDLLKKSRQSSNSTTITNLAC